MTRRSHSVAEMAADILDDPSAKERVEQLIANRKLIEQLILQRLLLEKTQTEVARYMGCNTSKISRMEAGSDQDLKLGDILGYLSALDMNLSMILSAPTSPITDRFKVEVPESSPKKLSQIEHRRDLIAENIKEARNEFARGEVEKGTAIDVMRESFENEREE